jgi:hypothetical protein
MEYFGVCQHSEALMGGYGYGHGTCIVTWVFDTNPHDFAQLILGRRDWICVGILLGTLRKRQSASESCFILHSKLHTKKDHRQKKRHKKREGGVTAKDSYLGAHLEHIEHIEHNCICICLCRIVHIRCLPLSGIIEAHLVFFITVSLLCYPSSYSKVRWTYR